VGLAVGWNLIFKKKMKITLFMATSLNGIIARPDYREDFLSNQNWYSFIDFTRETGALIWGRKTQDKARQHSPQALARMGDFPKIVVTTDTTYTPEAGFEQAASPQEAVDKLRQKGCKQATLAGGGILNSAFAREQLIDEVRVNVEAVIIGKGIPVFASGDFDIKLEFKECKQVNQQIVQLCYVVAKP
jgi:dihydrofolate reductase